MHTAKVSIPVDADVADVLLQAVAVEAEDGPGGVAIEVRRDGDSIVVELRADTVSGLRAALNSTLRLVDAAHRTVA